MSENMSIPREGIPVTGAPIFIDEMLSYVHLEFYGILREPFIPVTDRNTYREIVDLIFNRDLGDAVVKILRGLTQNEAEHLTVVEYQSLQPNAPVYIKHLLECHNMMRLTDEDFRRDYLLWSSWVVHWLAVLAAVCFFLERNGDRNGLLSTVALAGDILHNKMSGTPSTKMKYLTESARLLICPL